MKPEILGIIAGIFTATSLLPQLIKIIKEKQAKDLSLVMLLVLLTGLGLWAYYGILKEDWPIILTNSFSFMLNLMVLVLALKFKRQEGQV